MRRKNGPSAGASWWGRAARETWAVMGFWCLAAVLLSAVRVGLITAFRDRMGSGAGAAQVLTALANGGRFDAQTAFFWALIPFLCALTGREALARRVRSAFVAAFVAATLVLGVITFGFFREFDDQFNHFVLGVVFDDFHATLLTIRKSYPLFWILLAVCVFACLLTLLAGSLVRRFRAWPAAPESLPWWGKTFWTLGFIAFLAVASRGSLGTRPLQMKDMAVTGDQFLNKMIANPHRALVDAVRDYRKLADPDGIRTFLPDGRIGGALSRLFGGDGRERNLDDLLRRTAPGAADPPRHLFLIIMESYSAWPLMPAYASLGLAEEMRRLGREGFLSVAFLPAGPGTMTSVAPLLTGLADTGIPMNYQLSSRTPYPSSLAGIFRRLGYRTRLFYGGYLSWERMGDFARDQGFEEVYGGGDMGEWVKGNEWGVNDADLFDFVLGKVGDAGPSLNVVLTVSNHPPFEVDLPPGESATAGMPPELARVWDGGYTLRQMAHFRYADRCLGRFADGVERKLPKVLLAVTADHYGRRFLNGTPGMAERSLVPFLMHGPQTMPALDLPPKAWGSHMEVLPTLVELAAPAGFVYHALGRNILRSRSRDASFGFNRAVGPDFVAEFGDAPAWAPLPGAEAPARAPDLSALRRRDNDLKAVSWWRIMKGPLLPATGKRREGT